MVNPLGLFRTSLLYFLSGSCHSHSEACPGRGAGWVTKGNRRCGFWYQGRVWSFDLLGSGLDGFDDDYKE